MVKGAQAVPVGATTPLKVAEAVLAAVLPDTWPCDNYLRPTTCLTAPSAVGARCDFCREQSIAATPLP